MRDDANQWLSPEDQIAQVQASVAKLSAAPPGPVRDQALRDAAAYLEQLIDLHARGELHALANHTDLPL